MATGVHAFGSLNPTDIKRLLAVYHNSNLNCAEEHNNFQLFHYATYPRVYEAVANISEHQSPEEVILQSRGVATCTHGRTCVLKKSKNAAKRKKRDY